MKFGQKIFFREIDFFKFPGLLYIFFKIIILPALKLSYDGEKIDDITDEDDEFGEQFKFDEKFGGFKGNGIENGGTKSMSILIGLLLIFSEEIFLVSERSTGLEL